MQHLQVGALVGFPQRLLWTCPSHEPVRNAWLEGLAIHPLLRSISNHPRGLHHPLQQQVPSASSPPLPRTCAALRGRSWTETSTPPGGHGSSSPQLWHSGGLVKLYHCHARRCTYDWYLLVAANFNAHASAAIGKVPNVTHQCLSAAKGKT